MVRESDIIDAYVSLRRNDHDIPDEVLEFIKVASIEKLLSQDCSKDFYDQMYTENCEVLKKYTGKYCEGILEGLRLALIIFNETK